MIRPNELADDGLLDVTFTLPAELSGPISVVGDFNDWDPYADQPSQRRAAEHVD
ncbi:hypothetical protein [Nonomuraea indica]|uniref:Glycoside hydrolase family 13 N-terminal domain-containing protein n=1 Tax=Nonomuraea indica TaxID=1581193 RepID=A0ABW8ADQ7_9ACTN